MSFGKKPIVQFKDTAEIGISDVIVDRIVFVESENKLYTLQNKAGLNAANTVADAINGGNLVEISGGGSSGGGENVVYVNTTYSIAANDFIVSESVGPTLGVGVTAYTITLPSGPNNEDMVRIMDASGNSQNRPVLLTRNGNNIDGQADDLTLDVNYFDIKLAYHSGNWSLGGK